jgi:hypothetical protein
MLQKWDAIRISSPPVNEVRTDCSFRSPAYSKPRYRCGEGLGQRVVLLQDYAARVSHIMSKHADGSTPQRAPTACSRHTVLPQDVQGLIDCGKARRSPLRTRDRPRQATDRIDDGVDDVRPKRHRLALAKCFGSGGLDPTIGIARWPSTKNIIFATRVDADHSPHPMIMG